MGLFDGIEKLINEHGSATILKERIALANDKYSALEAKNKILSAENETLRIESEELKTQVKSLHSQLTQSDANRFTLKYGVFWDSNGNPFCPKCKLPLSRIVWAAHINRQVQSFRCSCTNLPIVLFEAGEPIQAPEAMRKMAKT